MSLTKIKLTGFRRWLPYGVLLVGLLITAAEAWHEHQALEARAQARFEVVINTTSLALERRIYRHIDALLATRALFAARVSVTRAEFRAYVDNVGLAAHYTGLGAIQYTPRETPATLEGFHARLKADGLGEHKLWGLSGGHNVLPPPAEEYFPVEYREPHTPLVLGFDVAAPMNLDAMARARDTGLASLAGKISQRVAGAEEQPGFLIYVPVYHNGAALQTSQQRHSALRGYVVGVFHAHDLLRDIYTRQNHPQIDFEVFDGAVLSRATLLFDDDGEAHALDPYFRADFRRTAAIEIAGHAWTLHFATLPGFDQDINQALPWIVLVSGATLSLLLFGFIRSQALARAQEKHISRELHASRANLARAQQIGRMGSWEVDLATGAWRWSDELCHLCDLTPSATQPSYQALLEMIYAEDRARVKTHLDAALNAGVSFGADHRLEVSGRRERYVYHHAEVILDHAGAPARVVGTLQDITERKRAERHAQTLNAELERRVQERTAELAAANQELEAFSYSVSHDLRAPLRAVDGFSQALIEDYGAQLDQTALGYLGRVRNASQHMATLIDDLLELARVTRSEMHREQVDLSAIAEDIVAELRKAHPGRVVEVVIAPALHAVGDARLLRVALTNLFSNAWKFTRKQAEARIEFTASRADGRPVYCVRDDGAGFNMAYVDRLFTPFQRLHPSSEFEGHGIGLATVKRILTRHGGRVWAEGEVGRGASFSFTLGERRAMLA